MRRKVIELFRSVPTYEKCTTNGWMVAYSSSSCWLVTCWLCFRGQIQILQRHFLNKIFQKSLLYILPLSSSTQTYAFWWLRRSSSNSGTAQPPSAKIRGQARAAVLFYLGPITCTFHNNKSDKEILERRRRSPLLASCWIGCVPCAQRYSRSCWILRPVTRRTDRFEVN